MTHDVSRTLRKTIVILSILLALSLTALTALLITSHFSKAPPSSATIPDNNISVHQTASLQPQYTVTRAATRTQFNTPTTDSIEILTMLDDIDQIPAASVTKLSYNSRRASQILELYRKQPTVNDPFNVTNMFPGDRETNDYCVRIHHKGSVVVHFRANVRPDKEYQKLAEVLKVKVMIEGKEYYDGLMRDMPRSIPYTTEYSRRATTTELDYKITAYLDTSVGNDYKNKDLVADFVWWVAVDTDYDDDDYTPSKPDKDKPTKPDTSEPVPPDVSEPTKPDESTPSKPDSSEPTDKPGGTLVDPPKTGDNFPSLMLTGLMFVSLIGLIFVLITGRRKEEDKHER